MRRLERRAYKLVLRWGVILIKSPLNAGLQANASPFLSAGNLLKDIQESGN